jgi:maleamate amidohydrolase
MPVWDSVIPDDELRRLESRGFGADVRLGERPCLVVVDVVMSFLGRRPGDQDGEDYATGCGDIGWERLPRIVELLEAARAADIPRVLTKGSPGAAAVVGGAIKLSGEPAMARRTHSAGFPEEIVPAADEFVLEKTKASAFFLTPLLTFLHQQRVDSIIIAGTTTSGCVRATAVDSASYGFSTVVAEDACFDRSQFAHAANLFDIQMKYGSVVTTAEVIGMLGSYGPHPRRAPEERAAPGVQQNTVGTLP